MMPHLVVTLQPFCTDFPHLIQGFKHIGTRQFGAIDAIESLNETILR
jgi:hypothetical protein